MGSQCWLVQAWSQKSPSRATVDEAAVAAAAELSGTGSAATASRWLGTNIHPLIRWKPRPKTGQFKTWQKTPDATDTVR